MPKMIIYARSALFDLGQLLPSSKREAAKANLLFSFLSFFFFLGNQDKHFPGVRNDDASLR